MSQFLFISLCDMSNEWLPRAPSLGDAVLRCKDYTQISGSLIKTDEPWQVRRQAFSNLRALPFVKDYAPLSECDNLMEKAVLTRRRSSCIHNTFLLHDTTCVCCCSVIMAAPNTSLHHLLQDRKMEQLHCDWRNWKHNSYLLRKKRSGKKVTNDDGFDWSRWTLPRTVLWWPSIKVAC